MCGFMYMYRVMFVPDFYVNEFKNEVLSISSVPSLTKLCDLHLCV